MFENIPEPAKKRIRLEQWVNIFQHDDGEYFTSCLYPSKFAADYEVSDTRKACVKIDIDVEEGSGL